MRLSDKGNYFTSVDASYGEDRGYLSNGMWVRVWMCMDIYRLYVPVIPLLPNIKYENIERHQKEMKDSSICLSVYLYMSNYLSIYLYIYLSLYS